MLSDYTNPTHPTTVLALAVAYRLSRWLDETVEAERRADSAEDASDLWDAGTPSVVVTQNIVSIGIGETMVWCTETDAIEDLTLEFCLRKFKRGLLVEACHRLARRIPDAPEQPEAPAAASQESP
jgi:hypothetical protein